MRVFQWLFLFFLMVPILEIYLLLKVGGLIGVLPTVVLVVGTAVLGAWMLRVQGLATWQRLQRSLTKGEIPALEMIEGPILLVGGALLLTPGFFTDAIGFFCLIPYTRRRIAAYLLNRINIKRNSQPAGERRPRDTIEGEYKRED